MLLRFPACSIQLNLFDYHDHVRNGRRTNDCVIADLEERHDLLVPDESFDTNVQ
jgi:hypothetical protein